MAAALTTTTPTTPAPASSSSAWPYVWGGLLGLGLFFGGAYLLSRAHHAHDE
jgi:hypothetical protein